MIISADEIKGRLKERGLKVTPQRISVLEAIYRLNNHPNAEDIINFIRKNHPSIALGTVYKVLDALVNSNLIQRVRTEKDSMRYDGIMDQHHHLYCEESEKIEDYVDNELDELLKNYFQKKGIPDFKVEEIKLQIKGRFDKT